jgi:GTPase
MFVDKVRVNISAGDGGDGAVNFRHEKFKPLGGPDGGDGGNGGNVILVASRNENTLAAFRYKKLLKAENGQGGSKRHRHGKSASALEVVVPIGTVLMSLEGEVLADLLTDLQKIKVAQGGKGGFGNAHFVSSTRQAPKVAEKGEKGQQLEAILELKMIADVGIVGLPNAGKSTLLSVISNAKPEIADYPFTTLHPNLGVVDIDKKHSLLFADIPGLIEGASKGKGLGDEFLRHVERTNVLVHLIDIYNEDTKQAYKTIQKELHDYEVDLSKLPQVVALTKIEGTPKKDLDKKINALKKLVPKGTAVMAISSVNQEGVLELLRVIQKMVAATKKKQAKKDAKPKLPVIGLKETEEDWQIKKVKNGFLVTGKKIERFAVRTHFEDYHGQQRFRDIMGKMGITKELEKLGIEADQKIQIGDPEIAEIEY